MAIEGNTDKPILSDADLMRHVQAGRGERFADVADRYQVALLRVARSRLGRIDWAEEVVQETLMAAFRSSHTYDPSRNFRTWLWTILLNQCKSFYRRRQRLARLENGTDQRSVDPAEGEQPQDMAESDEPAPLAALLAKERTELLDGMLRQLSAVQADAIRLRFFGGLKFEEIAEAMDCCLATAKNRVRWGLVKLAKGVKLAEGAKNKQADKATAGADSRRCHSKRQGKR